MYEDFEPSVVGTAALGVDRGVMTRNEDGLWRQTTLSRSRLKIAIIFE
jgi:hypothetical protein